MKVLVACEYSGIVRDAFENAGWDAWSCDLLPTESEQTTASGKHIIDDVEFLLLYVGNYEKRVEQFAFFGEYDGYDAQREQAKKVPKEWDLLIGHPPCTYLSFAYTGKERYSNNRLQQKIYAYQFFLDLWNAPIEHICLENPLGYIHSGLLPCTQIVEPYFFGDPYKKKTCLWLKNLPILTYEISGLFGKGTKVIPTHTLINCTPKSRRKLPAILQPFSTGKEKAKFHAGIAGAMAEQWTEFFKTIEKVEQIKNQ